MSMRPLYLPPRLANDMLIEEQWYRPRRLVKRLEIIYRVRQRSDVEFEEDQSFLARCRICGTVDGYKLSGFVNKFKNIQHSVVISH